MPTIRIRGNYGNNVILAEGKRSPKLLNFSEIFNKPLPFHDKEYSDFFFPLTQPSTPCFKTRKDLFHCKFKRQNKMKTFAQLSFSPSYMFS